MSKSGQNNFKGVNAQALAAMALFLQYLRDARFSHIHLEAEKFEDFDLVFEDGKRIICESKNWQAPFNYADLKHVLENILSKKEMGEDDEILIISNKVNEKLASQIKYVNFNVHAQQEFSKKGFSQDLISLLEHVKFWNVPETFSSEIVFSLISELINFWLPPEEVERLANNILIDKIYRGSAVGNTYGRAEFFAEIEKFKVEVQQSAEYFNENVRAREEQFKDLERIVKKEGKLPKMGGRSLSTFTLRWDLMSFAMDRLKTRSDLDLSKWADLWKMNRVYYFSFTIFEIFKNNLNTAKNRRYVIQYIKRYTRSLRGFYRSDFFSTDVVKILKDILQTDGGSEYLNDAFAIISELLTFDADQNFYLKAASPTDDQWERGEMCKLLLQIYESAETILQNKIASFVFSVFNLTENDGDFDWYTPKEVYTIIRLWLVKDLKTRLPKMVQSMAEQYDSSYGKFGGKIKFEGWEHVGGGSSFYNGDYSIDDRHFVRFVLKPALEDFYAKNEKQGWKYIKEHCITKAKDVSKNRPDFLNRSVYQIVLDRYVTHDADVSREAFVILKEFILSKGIPQKGELIFQAVLSSQLSPDKKWALVKLTSKYNAPFNVFAERIVRDLIKKGYVEAKELMRKWFGNEAYFKQFMTEHESIVNIQEMLEYDFEFAIELFYKLLQSENIANDKDKHFSSYNVARLLHTILKKDYQSGLNVLKWLNDQSRLSENQQIILAFSLFDHHGNDDSDNPSLLLSVYTDFIDPFLGTHKDVESVCRRLTHAHSRDAFVQFACRLAAKKEIEKALRIIEFFIDDPDPYLPGTDPEDKEDKYNENVKIEKGEEPHVIASVRGWCGWALMKCAILEGRDLMPRIIDLTRRLVLPEGDQERNYFLMHMGTFALTQIARNRLTVLPNDRDTLFLNNDKVTALKMAKEIEAIAFKLLDRLLTWPPLVQKAMSESVLRVFDHIRSLNEKDSLRLVKAISTLPADTFEHSAAYLIFYAEVRKDAFKNWRFSADGMYDDLGPDKYDDRKFKKVLDESIARLQKENPDSCFKFAARFEHAMRDAVERNEDKDKYTKLSLRYFDEFTDVYTHNIFTLIYQVLEQKFQAPDEFMEEWYALLIKCLRVEKNFYDEQVRLEKMNDVYWYPALYHSRILELLFERMGEERFMEAASIFFDFPNRMMLHESNQLVAIVERLASKDKRARKIVKSLRERNPSKYWDLGKK